MATINSINNNLPSGVTVSGGVVSINSGTNTLDISNDASATTISIGTGGAAKAITLGSTTTSSSLALQYGTADFTLASATGTVMSALDTGEITYPLQSAFLAYLASTDNNRTGNGAIFTIGSGTALTEVFDQNNDFVTSGTFTAPVTGRYHFDVAVYIAGVTIGNGGTIFIVTSNRQYDTLFIKAASNIEYALNLSCLADMDTGDTAIFQVQGSGEAGNTQDIFGAAQLYTFFSGYLAC